MMTDSTTNIVIDIILIIIGIIIIIILLLIINHTVDQAHSVTEICHRLALVAMVKKA